jgi:hypothetical protein
MLWGESISASHLRSCTSCIGMFPLVLGLVLGFMLWRAGEARRLKADGQSILVLDHQRAP